MKSDTYFHVMRSNSLRGVKFLLKALCIVFSSIIDFLYIQVSTNLERNLGYLSLRDCLFVVMKRVYGMVILNQGRCARVCIG